MQAEDANLRAMVTYLLESGDAETVLRVVGGSLSEYLFAVGGDVSVVRDWLGRAFQHGGGVSAEARAWGLGGIWMVTSLREISPRSNARRQKSMSLRSP